MGTGGRNLREAFQSENKKGRRGDLRNSEIRMQTQSNASGLGGRKNRRREDKNRPRGLESSRTENLLYGGENIPTDQHFGKRNMNRHQTDPRFEYSKRHISRQSVELDPRSDDDDTESDDV